MKTIGLLGGMSWESTAGYYKMINEAVRESLGGLHSAPCVLYSVDFDEIERRQRGGGWQGCAGILHRAATALQTAGAEAIVLCTNTMHKVADAMMRGISIPLLHIGDVTADALVEKGMTTAALLGTSYTMEQEFYRARLERRGLRVLIPDAGERAELNRIIFEELCQGIRREESRQFFLRVIDRLRGQGAQGIILGCTEIGMLVRPEDAKTPVFDTTRLHAGAAARFVLTDCEGKE